MDILPNEGYAVIIDRHQAKSFAPMLGEHPVMIPIFVNVYEAKRWLNRWKNAVPHPLAIVRLRIQADLTHLCE